MICFCVKASKIFTCFIFLDRFKFVHLIFSGRLHVHSHTCTCVVYSYADSCINITTHNNNRRAKQFLEKYTSHLFERVVCERELGTEQNFNILTPTLMTIGVSFPFSWAAQPAAWGSASLSASFLYHILSPTRLISKLINRGSEGSLCWVLAFSTASCLQTN